MWAFPKSVLNQRTFEPTTNRSLWVEDILELHPFPFYTISKASYITAALYEDVRKILTLRAIARGQRVSLLALSQFITLCANRNPAAFRMELDAHVKALSYSSGGAVDNAT